MYPEPGPDPLSLTGGFSFGRLPHFSLISSVCQPPPPPSFPPLLLPFLSRNPPLALHISTPRPSHFPRRLRDHFNPRTSLAKSILYPVLRNQCLKYTPDPALFQSIPDDSPFLATNQPLAPTNPPPFTLHISLLEATTSHAVLSSCPVHSFSGKSDQTSPDDNTTRRITNILTALFSLGQPSTDSRGALRTITWHHPISRERGKDPPRLDHSSSSRPSTASRFSLTTFTVDSLATSRRPYPSPCS